MPTTWDLSPLLDGGTVADLVERAGRIAAEIDAYRGCVASLDVRALAELMRAVAAFEDLVRRVESYARLALDADRRDDRRDALARDVAERVAELRARVTLEYEWAEVPEARVAFLLRDPRLDFCRQYLWAMHARRRHLLSESVERNLAEKSVTGERAWAELLGELIADLRVNFDGIDWTLDEACSLLASSDGALRRGTAAAVAAALEPGLRARAFVIDTLVADRAADDGKRGFDQWLTRRNLEHEVTDAGVADLIDAVVGRFDIPRDWYRLKARLAGVARLADHDLMAPVIDTEADIPWAVAAGVVTDAYAAFSPELGALARRGFDEGWIDPTPRMGKRGGAACDAAVPGVHPFVRLDYTGRRRDVLALAGELGRALHAALAAPRGVLEQRAPRLIAETAAAFGETLVFDHLLGLASTPAQRLALLADRADATIATVFGQTAVHRFEESIHRARRDGGPLTERRLTELWLAAERELFGGAVDLTGASRGIWSILAEPAAAPGTAHARVFARLAALSLREHHRAEGPAFAAAYLQMLSAGGSRPAGVLARLVGCDLAAPGLWERGLAAVSEELAEVRSAARPTGRPAGRPAPARRGAYSSSGSCGVSKSPPSMSSMR